ncbi:MAG: hypothetical protein HN392_13050 [Anaerolineae bacterium]|jgi:hypothetical protein|nr:hypothetical protein [Anaerolineae bacterium]MBT7073323.1 hypothetical protein [Anaerolineae bacterium]MBT7782230.1 hypothetical protein [Anaerolineae bacterium]
MTKDTFDTIILIGRPASGKSEIIAHLKDCQGEKRCESFHIAKLDFLDDFPMLWTWFEEDHILENILGKTRLYTDSKGYFKEKHLWHLLIERFNIDYPKRLRTKNYHDDHTLIIEFSRGSEHGGYIEAFEHIGEDILKRAAIVYVNVPYEESLRKNRRRFNPDRPDTILEHGLPDEKLERLYKEVDWEEFSKENPEFIEIKGIKVPYAVFENEDDVTTNTPSLLAERLEEVLTRLWRLQNK